MRLYTVAIRRIEINDQGRERANESSDYKNLWDHRRWDVDCIDDNAVPSHKNMLVNHSFVVTNSSISLKQQLRHKISRINFFVYLFII